MNKQYRIVWNESSQCWVAVTELATSRGKSKSLCTGLPAARRAGAHLLQGLAFAVGALVLGLGLAYAAPPAANQLPTGGQVVAGQATLNPSGNVLTVNQSSNAAILNWQSFDVGSAAAVNFVQPSAASTTLNRVQSSNPSQIFGRITAPGQVFFTNPGGMYFAPGSSVDVGGLTATTHSISDADFMAGNYRFERDGATGAIVNQGTLSARLGGYIALLAPEVRNQGVIVARMGTVALAAGESYTLQMQGSQLSNVRVSPATIQALVDNTNAVMAPGGLIILSAQAANQLQGSVVNNSGAVVAQGLSLRNGRVVLDAGANGTVTVSGAVSTANDKGAGGDITVTGRDIHLQNGAQLDASGTSGGGNVLVGGDWQGSGTLLQATTVTLDAGARIDASATQNGDGGKVVLWSDVHNAAGHTDAHGSIFARGGVSGGHGGRIETSGHAVHIAGATINAGADRGAGGQWLLDPTDYTIDATAANTIQTSLDAGTSVTIDTANSGGPGAGAGTNGDITVDAAIAKTTGSAADLTLNASRNIALNASISTSTANSNLIFNAGGAITSNSAGTLNSTGAITLTAGNIVVGGTIAATGDILLNADTGSQLSFNGKGVDIAAGVSTSGAGNITIVGRGGDNSVGSQDGIRLSGASVSTTGTGNITLTGRGGASTGNSNYGIELSLGSAAQIFTASGNITLTGYGGGAGSTTALDAGVFQSTTTSIASGGAGTVNITGTGGSAASNGNGMRGIYLNGGSINSSGGAITLTGTSGGNASGTLSTYSGIQIDTSGNIGASSGSAPISLMGTDSRTGANGIRLLVSSLGGNSYTGNIVLRADGLSTTSTSAVINTSGTLSIEPLSASFIGAGLNTTLYTLSRLTGLTLGKSGNTGAITWGNTASIAGPISLTGGNLAINTALTATGTNTIALASSGTVTEGASGYVVADKLLLQGGNATLTNASNAIGTLAASGMGSLTYADSDALTIGTVGSTSGIGASGAVSVSTLVNDLTVSQGIATTDSSASALVLNAGQTTAAGTSTGGNVIVIGNPAITIGAGGTAKLFTGSVSGSTGVTAAVGAGTGRFRYNSDESSTGYSLALATGVLNAIYRERPTISVTADNKTVTYGTAPTLTTSVSSQNGDTAAQAFSSMPTVAVGGSTSTSGNYTANTSHVLTASGAADQVGYAVGYNTGALTVTQKALAYTGTVNSRAYNGNTSATMADSASGVVGSDVVSVASTGATFDGNGNTGTGKTVSVTGVGISNTDAANYTIAASSSKTGTITQRGITLASLSAADKTYDGNTLASIVGGSFANLVGSETLNISGGGTFSDRNAANGKTVTVADLSTLGKADGSGLWSNYNLTSTGSATANASIFRKTITLTAGSVAKIYDGQLTYATQAADLGLLGSQLGVSGDTVSAATIAYTDRNAGTGKTVTLNHATINDGNNGNNYTVTLLGNSTSRIDPATQLASAYDTINAQNNSPSFSGHFGETGAGAPGLASAPPLGNEGGVATSRFVVPPRDASGIGTVWLQVVRAPSVNGAGFTLVYVPTSLRNAGKGFRFTLPEQTLAGVAPEDAVQATLPNGDALPDWLRFDSRTRSFVADSVPPNGLPLRVRVISGSKSSLLELLETNG